MSKETKTLVENEIKYVLRLMKEAEEQTTKRLESLKNSKAGLLDLVENKAQTHTITNNDGDHYKLYYLTAEETEQYDEILKVLNRRASVKSSHHANMMFEEVQKYQEDNKDD